MMLRFSLGHNGASPSTADLDVDISGALTINDGNTLGSQGVSRLFIDAGVGKTTTVTVGAGLTVNTAFHLAAQ